LQLLRAGRFTLALDRPLIMAVVNITPDSFSDGGRFYNPSEAIAGAHRLIDEGADMLDIGGESSRPGAEAVDASEELQRILPVITALRDVAVPISVDTSKPAVMRAALDAGASMVNDIEALQVPGALAVMAASDAAVCLMHMQGRPRNMQQAPQYEDVVAEVSAFLNGRAEAAMAAGIARERIVIDPGFGFGKSVEHNLELLRHLRRFTEAGFPVLAGWSRKSTLGAITGRPVEQRLHASVAAALLAVERGASIVRVHDVAATRDALAVWMALRGRSAANATNTTASPAA